MYGNKHAKHSLILMEINGKLNLYWIKEHSLFQHPSLNVTCFNNFFDSDEYLFLEKIF